MFIPRLRQRIPKRLLHKSVIEEHQPHYSTSNAIWYDNKALKVMQYGEACGEPNSDIGHLTSERSHVPTARRVIDISSVIHRMNELVDFKDEFERTLSIVNQERNHSSGRVSATNVVQTDDYGDYRKAV